jgi:hypothetical protein
MGRNRQLAVLALGLALSCGREPPGVERQASQPPPPAPSLDKPFVVFSRPSIVIDRLEVPVPSPVTVGSQPSPETLTSDAPGIVSVDPSGSLVAHRNGEATVRASRGAGAALAVEVRAVSVLAIQPAEMLLRPAEEKRLKLFSGGGGEEVPSGAAVWSTDDPRVAVVIGGIVTAGDRPGTATITASYGGQASRAIVIVARDSGPAFAIRPESPRLRVGDVVTFDALSSQGPVRPRWDARPPRILAQSGPSTFSAKAAGKSVVCATAGGRSVCTTVAVRP